MLSTSRPKMSTKHHPVYQALLGLRIGNDSAAYLEKRELGHWVESVRQFYWHGHRVHALPENDALDLYIYLTREYD